MDRNTSNQVFITNEIQKRNSSVDVNGEQNSSKRSNSIHKQRFKKKTSLVCGECGDVFYDMGDLRRHLGRHRIKNKSISESFLPRLIHCGPRLFECNICDRVFSESGYLKLHVKIHQGLKPYRCSECNLAFDSCIELQKHFNTHVVSRTPSKLRKCDICQDIFPSAEEYAQHLKSHKETQHEPSLEPMRASKDGLFECKICNRQIRGSGPFRMHMIIKHEKKYLCPKCSERFKSKHLLALHTCQESYTCTHGDCKSVFSTRSAYSIHIRNVHKKSPKTYACSICKKAFVSQVTLEAHLRTHTGEKPFSCEFCGKKFSQMHSRDRHVLTHIGEKNEICPLCHKAFMTKDQVKVHMIVHNTDDPVHCPHCGKEFKGDRYLKNHLARCKSKPSEDEVSK